MDPALRELIDHSKFHQGAVRAAAALLPIADDELAAAIDETIALGDQLGFVLMVTAALDAGRRVDASHLVGGTALVGDVGRLGGFAWKMEGDVPGALMGALAGVVLPRQIHAGVLFVIAAWCAEKRDGRVPSGFAAEARHFARVRTLKDDALAYLVAAAVTAKDDGFLAVLRQNFPNTAKEGMLPLADRVVQATLAVFAQPVMAGVPAAPPPILAHGRPMRRAVEKLGRNDLCHCGSGRKYKRCCSEKDEERLHFSTEVAGHTHAELRADPAAGLTESRLKSLAPFELVRIDPARVPEALRRPYIMQVAGFLLLDRAVEYFEVLEWNEEIEEEWDFVLFFIMREQRKELAERMVAVRALHPGEDGEPVEIRAGVRLLLARDDPAEELRVLAEIAREILDATDPEQLVKLGYGVLCSRHTEVGILICRSLIATLPRKQATFLLEQILEARDKLDLPPDEPFGDLLEKRLADETPDEGTDAAALRAARRRLEAKAAEVRELSEKIERQRRALDRREQEQKASAPAAPHLPADAADVPQMRLKLAQLKSLLGERSAERATLRRELEKARDDLEARQSTPSTPAPAEDPAGAEAEHYLPAEDLGQQPLRLVEFPHKFRETLESFPRPAARAALALLGRLAGGEPAAFTGLVQLKACHGIFRQRIGSDHRLLFRLLPDRVQVVDLINRRDLDRKVKTLRASH
jgi:hypothetical protein